MPMLSGTFSAYQVASPWLMGSGNARHSHTGSRWAKDRDRHPAKIG